MLDIAWEEALVGEKRKHLEDVEDILHGATKNKKQTAK